MLSGPVLFGLCCFWGFYLAFAGRYAVLSSSKAQTLIASPSPWSSRSLTSLSLNVISNRAHLFSVPSWSLSLPSSSNNLFLHLLPQKRFLVHSIVPLVIFHGIPSLSWHNQYPWPWKTRICWRCFISISFGSLYYSWANLPLRFYPLFKSVYFFFTCVLCFW